MYNFIVNPKARSHQGIAVWKNLKKILDDRDIEYKEFLTKGPDYAKKVANRLTENPNAHPIIIVLGGDGTLNEVLNGICFVENVTLGYIPIGSSNDFARGMGITSDPEMMLENIITNPQYTYIDYGIAKIGNVSKRYIVSAGIGYDAGVCYETNYSSIKTILNRLKLGKFTYIVIALKQLVAQPKVKADICIDDKVVHLNKMILLATHIQKYEGGGLMFCPRADYADGILDICTANNIPKLKILLALPTAYKGNHTRFKGIETHTCKRIRVTCDKPLYVHTDGEAFVLKKDNSNVVMHQEITFMNSEDKIKYIVG